MNHDDCHRHKKDKPHVSRRSFLKLTAAALASSPLTTACGGNVGQQRIRSVTDADRALRRNADSPLAIAYCESYEEDMFKLLKPLLKDLDLPDLTGKSVLIKPNIVDAMQGRPLTTNPAMLAVAAQLVDYLGAKDIVIGEGPAHNRDTELILERSGMRKVITKLGVKFVDLNIDDLEKYENPNGFSKLETLFLPKSVANADIVVSLPKLKTHHWARLTCSMKNLYGTVPGRKYGWPKNTLHFAGIDNCTLDLVRLIKPAIQLVDAVVAMEGDGPLYGTAKQANFIMLGTDPVAVDSTCARIMGIDPVNVPYLHIGGQAIGHVDPARIKIFGTEIAKVASNFKPAPTFDATGRELKHQDARTASS